MSLFLNSTQKKYSSFIIIILLVNSFQITYELNFQKIKTELSSRVTSISKEVLNYTNEIVGFSHKILLGNGYTFITIIMFIIPITIIICISIYIIIKRASSSNQNKDKQSFNNRKPKKEIRKKRKRKQPNLNNYASFYKNFENSNNTILEETSESGFIDESTEQTRLLNSNFSIIDI